MFRLRRVVAGEQKEGGNVAVIANEREDCRHFPGTPLSRATLVFPPVGEEACVGIVVVGFVARAVERRDRRSFVDR